MKKLFNFFKNVEKKAEVQSTKVPEGWKEFFTNDATIKNLEGNRGKYQYYINQVKIILENNVELNNNKELESIGSDIADNPFLYNAIRGLKIKYLDCKTGYSREVDILPSHSYFSELTVTQKKGSFESIYEMFNRKIEA